MIHMQIPSTHHYGRISQNSAKYFNAPTKAEILDEICDIFSTSVEQLSSKCRKREMVLIRVIYAYVAQLLTKSSLQAIGETINRGHDEVIYYREAYEKFIFTKDSKFKERWDRYLSLSIIWNEYAPK